MRAIDADELRIALFRLGGNISLEQFERYIKTFPVVEVEPVKHGYWIYTGEWNLPECSICRKVSHSALYGDEDAYCPYCGAKMDGDGE